MIEIPSLRPETRYGMATADMLLFNRQYIVGYSNLFRQPRWAMELIDPLTQSHLEADLARLNNFREDLRVPEMFRATLADYAGSGYDRGHLISSADRMSRTVLNSETFLLTNMSPQAPGFNRGVWKELEQATRDLAGQKDIVEVYMICGPLFNVGDPVDVIGRNQIVVPDGYFKSVLAENRRGTLQMWTFAFDNKETKDHYSKFLVKTEDVERWAGLALWDRLHGEAATSLRRKISKIWAGGSPPAKTKKKVKKAAAAKK
jgi:endonuclease G